MRRSDEAVFERDWEAMERSYDVPGPFQMLIEGFCTLDCFVEKDFGKTICLLCCEMLLRLILDACAKTWEG